MKESAFSHKRTLWPKPFTNPRSTERATSRSPAKAATEYRVKPNSPKKGDRQTALSRLNAYWLLVSSRNQFGRCGGPPGNRIGVGMDHCAEF